MVVVVSFVLMDNLVVVVGTVVISVLTDSLVVVVGTVVGFVKVVE